MNKQKVKVCAYTRMSTDRQDTSIAIQELRIKELAERENYEIVAWYSDEGKSGSRNIEKRTAFNQMLADAKIAEWQYVLVLNRSRWGRMDSQEGAQSQLDMRAAGKKLHTVQEGIADWDTSEGRMIDSMHTEQANKYAVTIGNNTLEGRLNTFLDNRAVGFRCPYGLMRKVYTDDGDVKLITRHQQFTKPKTWREDFIAGDEAEVKVVQWLFAEVDQKDTSYRELANQLNAKNTPAPLGGKWCAEIVKRLLRNEKYVGDSTFGVRATGKFYRLNGTKVVQSRFKQGLTRSNGITKTGIYRDAAIVDRAVWDRVQVIMKKRQNGGDRGIKEGGYTLKGLLWCGQCGKPLYGLKMRGEKKSGQVTYTCRSGIVHGKAASCPQWQIREIEIMPYLTEKLVKEIDRKRIEAATAKPKKEENQEAAQLRKKLDAIIKRIDNGTERFLDSPAELAKEIGEKLSQWKAERDQLKSRLEAAERAASQCKVVDQVDWQRIRQGLVAVKMVSLAAAPAKIYSVKYELPPENFRAMLLQAGCKVDVWWEKSSQNRYNVEEIRVRIGQTQKDTSTSENMVSCEGIDITFTPEKA